MSATGARGARRPSRARLAAGRTATAMLRRMGFEVVPLGHSSLSQVTAEQARRDRLLRHLGVGVVLDVGANAGQYALELRRAGYAGRIVSFEPLSAAFEALQEASAGDPAWDCLPYALGSADGSAAINIAGNSYSSSLLGMMDRHLDSAPESRYVGTEEVVVRTLDSVWDDLVQPGEQAYLKLDTQGFELEVLRGARASLARLAAVQAELSLVPLYEGAPAYREVIDHLEAGGFHLAGLEAGHDDRRTGEMLQMDGIFIR